MAGITVTGQGQATGAPDIVSIAARVSVGRPEVAEAVRGAADAAARLQAAVVEAGVEPGDVSTTGYHLATEHDPDDHRRVVGYRAEHSVAIVVRDVGRAGAVLDAATVASIDDVRVDGLAFAIADEAPLAATARRLAWEDARDRAVQLAGHAGLTVGKAETIDETVGTGPVPVPKRMLAAMESATPITAGQQTVTVQVTVTFAVEE